jgi:uncharacterized integral membrane protein
MRREDDQEAARRAKLPPRPEDEAVGRVSEDQQHLRQLQRERQGRVVKVIVTLAIVVVLIVFIIANSQPVKVNFVFVTRHPRLIWVMVACAVLGGVAGYLIGRPGKQIRLHRRERDDRGDRGEDP